MAKAIILTLWFITVIILLSVCLDMISAANTVENCVGLLLLVVSVSISIKTKCFIKIISLWKKFSKSESER